MPHSPCRRTGAVALVAIAAALAPPALRAHADTPPTQAQLEQAKQAFADGKQLHDAGKLADAIEKFKRSYELSRNPLLLYNIALTMQELGSDDLAIVYYRRFLTEAPADAAQRADAASRIAALTRKLAPPSDAAPAGGAAAFDHQPVESAPPGKPLDLTAVVAAAGPDPGSSLRVTLFFRAAGQPAFTSTPMLPHDRDRELVARIPASRVTGSALQYYIEARDASGALVSRSGKSTVPNVIAIDPAAPARFYPDVAEPVLTDAPPARDAENPLAPAAPPALPPPPPPTGLLEVGSRRFAYAKWSTTALAAASVTAGITLYVLARDHARALEDDASGCGTPPCQAFDDFDRDIQRTGKLEQTLSNAALFGGLAISAVAAYLWVRELTAAPATARTTAARARRSTPAAPTWLVIPTIGATRGAAAAVRF